MKITKSYLKQIIKEEMQNIIESDFDYSYAFNEEVIVEMPSQDFIDLTFEPKENPRIEKETKEKLEKYKQSLKSSELPFLFLDSQGKVRAHEGRHRAYANILINGPEAKFQINIKIQGITYQELLKSGRMIIGQFDTSIRKDPKQYKISKEKITTTDFLNVGSEQLVFKPTIRPPTPYTKEEYVDPGYRRALTQISLAQFEYVKNYKRANKIEDTTREEKYQLAQEFEDYANKNYVFKAINTDGKEQILKVVDKSKFSIIFSFEPLPDPKATVIIEKR
jgi:hypothetical protein